MKKTNVCGVCCEEIQQHAKICKYCGSQQSKVKRGLYNISKSIGFLLAVLSLTVLSITSIKNIIDAYHPDLNLNIIQTDTKDNFVVSISNLSNESISIINLYVLFRNKFFHSNQTYDTVIRLNDEVSNKILPPNTTSLLKFNNENIPTVKSSSLKLIGHLSYSPLNGSECELKAVYLIGNKTKVSTINFQCYPHLTNQELRYYLSLQ